MTDPIVEEIRKYRNEHARQFNYDLDKICEDLMRKQEMSGRKIRRRNESTTIGSTSPRKLGT